MERYRKEVMGARLVLVEGVIQRSPEGVVHLVAQRLVDRSPDLALLADDLVVGPERTPAGAPGEGGDDFRAEPMAPPMHRHPRDVRVLPPSRDFR
jgi:error-prone DNA polymerase